MQRYITFLSGIPVGSSAGGMQSLQRLFTQLGFSQVETYLQSGNVIFETAPVGVIPPFEAQIARYLRKSLGGEVEVFIRTPDELKAIVDQEPYPGEDTTGSLFVVLLHEPVSDRVQRELRFLRTSADEFRANGREIYWLRRKSSDSGHEPPPSIAEKLGMPATLRTFSTLQKLAVTAERPRHAKHYAEPATESAQSRR